MLSELHDKAPVHSWEASKAAIETAFGQPVEQLFECIDHSAIASGSIAQVGFDSLTVSFECIDHCATASGSIAQMGLTFSPF